MPTVSERSILARAETWLTRAETWLLTGPVGHLLGGTIDVLNALARYLLAWIRGQIAR